MDSQLDLNKALSKNELIAFEKLKTKWKELPVEDIILDGLYLNCIRLVKEYFDKYLKIDLKLKKINDIGLKSVLQLLADKDLRGAETLLRHMNFDSNQKIFEISMYTPYKQLRDYLVTILIDRQHLKDSDMDIINYVKQFEIAYPCRSYEQVKYIITPFKKMEDGNKRTPNENFICKDLVKYVEKTDDIEGNRYGHIILEWIRKWPSKSRMEILADSIITNTVDAEIVHKIDPEALWAVLIEQNKIELILEWIKYTFEDEKSIDLELTNKSDKLFTTKVTQEMIDLIQTTKYITKDNKDLILNNLARYNKFCTMEERDFNLKLKRLSINQTLFDIKLFKQLDNNFHLSFIMKCLNCKLIPVEYLWSYLDFYNNAFADLNKTSQALISDSENIELISSKCLKMMMAFRQYLNTNVTVDPSAFFSNICMKNFEFCLSHNNKDEGPFQISSFFSNKHKEHHLLALAMSLYFDIPLSTNESSTLEHLLDDYPSLRLIVDSKQPPQPISVYALLQEHTKLDMAKCFNWQKTNTLGLFKHDSDTAHKSKQWSTILSFENTEFAKRYSYKDSLDFAYFIRKGRPFFAYYYFISEQLKKYGKINSTLMEEARLRTDLILIENFDNKPISTSCIVFSELLNADTFKLKLKLKLMNIYKEHKRKHGMDETMAADECRSFFVQFFKGEIEPQQVVTLFESFLATQMTENFDLQHMFTMEAASIWLPLMCFCKVYNLPYSCKYLNLCAESNEWLMYLIFAQLYQIPRYQVISGLEHFTDIGLKQHLEYALHNVITSSITDSSDSHQSMSSRLKKSLKDNKFTSILSSAFKTKKNTKKNSSKSQTASGNQNNKSDNKGSKTNESSENDEGETEFEPDQKASDQQVLKDCLDSVDFYELLINCQNASEPVLQLQLEALRWFTPVLAVFATFYQQHDKISCLCTFLYSSMKHQIYSNIITNKCKLNTEKNPSDNNKPVNKSILFGLNDLKDAIQIAASKSFLRTLLNSFRIFIPKTILDIYVEFLYSIFVIKDISQAQKLHASYKHELIKVTLSKHQSYIPLEWYEEVINKLTRITIIKCHIIDDLQNLTNILGPNNEYRRLIKLVYTLKSNKISVNYTEEWLDMNDSTDQFSDICFKVIEELLKIQKFNEAEELADYCELSKYRIHLARIARQIEILRLNNDFEEILEFWKSAHFQLMKIDIKDTDFIDFLKFQSSRSNLILERIVLLNLICQLCPNDLETSKNLWVLLFHYVIDSKKKNDVTNLRDIFKKILLFGSLKADPLKDLIDYVIKEGRANDFNEGTNSLNDQEKDALNTLLFNLVDIGKLTQAYLIAKHFKYFNQDFRILLNMIYICLDMIKPEELDYNSQAFDTASFKGIKLTNVLRSLSRTADSNQTTKDKIDYLEKLVDLCNYGNKFSKRIKLDFQLANETLKVSFTKIINENEWTLLKMILYTDYSNKYDIAQEFVVAYELNQKKLCEFLLEELLNTLNQYVIISKNEFFDAQSQPKQLIYDPTNNDQFSKLIKIFDKNIHKFGWKLLNKCRLKLMDDAKYTTDDYIILTEMLIRSHDCFTQSCSMEGISNVLQTCKLCATKLEKAGEFNIMIRLLTGIAHFSEMTYIMDYLWNNHQFEMLFGKGIGKEDKLRLALLDYLKRFHPNDHETYTMVTLNFTMHREIANMLEEAAYKQLKLLENKQLENTSEILTDLQSILQYFSDAAQSYMKDDCVKHAETCIRKARLIALQIHFLSSNIIIVNLNSTAASKFIVNHKKFWEAFIVSEAYDKKSDWPQALFNQFILNNNEKYFIDFKAHIQLSPNIIEEVSNRYKIWNETNNLSSQSVSNMKHLLKYCKDISQYYRLVSSLEFKDLISDIQINKSYSSIINDLIMNKRI